MNVCATTRETYELTLGGGLDAAEVGLDAARVAAADAHAAGCAECAAEAAAWRDLLGDVEDALTPPADALPDDHVAERVVAALPAGRVVPLWSRAAVAAAVLAAAGMVAWQLRPLPEETPVAEARPYPLEPPSAPDYAGPRFADVSEAAGVTKLDHTGVHGAKDWMVEVVGHGAAAFDIDSDGDLDLFVPDGNRIDPGARVENTWRMYRNDGDMRFTDVTASAGLSADAWAGGAVAGDLDADGDTDLFVPCFGVNRLFLNRGDGTFEDATERAGVAGREEEWSTAAALGDVDGDGDLDLYVANYADMRRFIVEAGVGRGCRWREMPVPCGPQPMLPQRDRLYLNRGDGTFVDGTEACLPQLARYSFQPVLTDLDGDGALDVFVAADGHPNLLFLNDGTGRFSEQGRASGVAVDADAREQACMGVACGDVDGDGMVDLFVTNFSHEPNVLYRARPGTPGNPVFVDVTRGADLDGPSFFTLGWGVALVDMDCDGDLDAFTANGHLYPGVEESVPSTAYEQHVSVLENLGHGRFREVTAAAGDGVRTPRVHRGLLVADFDDDGAPDVFTTVLNGRATLLRNDARGVGRSVRLILRRADGRTEAAGARALVRTPEREVVRDLLLGSSFGSSEDPRLLVGIGEAASAELRVRWPRRAGGAVHVESFGPLEAGGTYLVVEGSGRARRVR
jgi:hypothetical protein